MAVYILDVCRHCGKTTRHAVKETAAAHSICTTCGGEDCRGPRPMGRDYWRGLAHGLFFGAMIGAIWQVLRDFFYTS